MDGWGQLGRNLFGSSEGAYQRGVTQGVDLQTKMMGARKLREQEVARSQFANALGAMGLAPEQAQGMATLLQGGANPHQVSQGALGMQQHGQRGQLWDAVQGGAGVDQINPMLAALQGKPVDLTRVAGGVAYNPMVTPDQSQMTATPVGESQMLAQQARANHSNAAAGAQAALARLHATKADAGGFAPRAAGGGSATFGRPQVTLMDRLLQTGEGAPDSERQREFIIWQGRMADTDPRYRDPQFALGRYLEQTGDPGMGNFFDGSDVPQRVDLTGEPSAAGVAGPVRRARNPTTGEVLELRNGQWVPAQ